MSEKAPLGLGSNFDSSEVENEQIGVESADSLVSKLKAHLGKYSQIATMTALLVGAPLLENPAEAQNREPGVEEVLKKISNLFHTARISFDGYLKVSFARVESITTKGKGPEAQESALNLIKDINDFVEGFKVKLPGQSEEKFIFELGVDYNMADLFLFQDDLIQAQAQIDLLMMYTGLKDDQDQIIGQTKAELERGIKILNSRLKNQ